MVNAKVKFEGWKTLISADIEELENTLVSWQDFIDGDLKLIAAEDKYRVDEITAKIQALVVDIPNVISDTVNG